MLRPMDGASVKLELELQFDGDSIRGVLTDEAGTAVDIVGRIGLLAAIDAVAQDRGHGVRAPAAAAAAAARRS
jgi:hypothetical protein